MPLRRIVESKRCLKSGWEPDITFSLLRFIDDYSVRHPEWKFLDDLSSILCGQSE